LVSPWHPSHLKSKHRIPVSYREEWIVLLQAVGFQRDATESTFGTYMQYRVMRGICDTEELCDFYTPAGILAWIIGEEEKRQGHVRTPGGIRKRIFILDNLIGKPLVGDIYMCGSKGSEFYRNMCELWID
jgi:hypothetical protein